MSPSAYITVRETRSGRRFVVRYRLAGRQSKLVHAGSFKTRKDAQARIDLIRGELAAGRDPLRALAALAAPGAPPAVLRDDADRYAKSRVDVTEGTANNIRSHLLRIIATLGDRTADSLTWQDVQDWVATNDDLGATTMPKYLATFRLLLDFAGVDPNPARDPRIRLPRVVKADVNPPSNDHFLKILGNVPGKYVLPLELAEQTGMRVGEIATLAWGDVDEAGCRIRLSADDTKTRRARWVQVPDWLMGEIALTVAREDRTAERRVFPTFTPSGVLQAMRRACVTAGIPHYHPHELRHRRFTIWHHSGVPAKVMAERGGHSRASLSIDVYSHTMPLTEIPEKELQAALVRSR